MIAAYASCGHGEDADGDGRLEISWPRACSQAAYVLLANMYKRSEICQIFQRIRIKYIADNLDSPTMALGPEIRVSTLHSRIPEFRATATQSPYRCLCCGALWPAPGPRIHATPYRQRRALSTSRLGEGFEKNTFLKQWQVSARRNAVQLATDTTLEDTTLEAGSGTSTESRIFAEGGNDYRSEGKAEGSSFSSFSEDENTSEEEESSEEEFGLGDYEFDSEEKHEVSNEVQKKDSDPLTDRAQKIDELCAKVRGTAGCKITSRDLISLYNFRLDKFQRLAIEGFLKGSSVVVSAPTSSGKTLIAEAAAAATLAKCRRLFYTTPLKALSNQKFREFRAAFGEASVGLLTGDVSFNRDAPIVIMTAEILRNKFYLSAGNEDNGNLFADVDVVVLDEIHYLSDIFRGTVWEETVIYCPKKIQLICLSATIANPDELAGWIAKVHGPTELITSSKRPVPLIWHVSRRSHMLPLVNDKGTGINRKLLISGEQLEDMHFKRKKMRTTSFERKMPEDQMQLLRRMQVPRISDTLRQLVHRNMLPAIWFIFSRKRCDEAVQYLENAGLLSEEEFGHVDQAVKNFREQQPDALRESAVKALYQGVAAHHAGCLPVWKAFIEELFQKGLVKVVFATETLAAGINMPARTTVLSSFIGRGHGAERQSSANSVLQMAGRAGRRGIDNEGHVVVVQTPFRGPEDCYRMLRTGSDPLVSQFTATYGMVLNLLAGPRVKESEALEVGGEHGKSLDEARGLIEQSFGNYMGSEILVGARAKLVQLQAEIESLEAGHPTDSLSKYYDERLCEYNSLLEKLEMKERKERSLRFKFERLKLAVVQSQLKELSKEQLPYVRVSYVGIKTGEEHTLSALYVEKVNQNAFTSAAIGKENKEVSTGSEAGKEKMDSPYLALGSDNCWYRFPAIAVNRVYRSELSLEQRANLKTNLSNDLEWEVIGLDNVMRMKNSSTSCNIRVPAANELTNECEAPEELKAAATLLLMQQRSITKLSKKVEEIDKSEMDTLSERIKKIREEKIARLKAKSERIANRIKLMQPSGWREFKQVVKVLRAAGAMHQDTHDLLPLGEIARAIRGTNELWLAIALQDRTLPTLKPSELAAVAATLVSESMKARFESVSSPLYEPSNAVKEWVETMESNRQWLLKLHEDHNVEFACELDPQVAGFVEAWASGVSWKELGIVDIMDEGDFARLLRRTIDLLTQIPYVPHINHALSKTAREAAKFMDRPPISEQIAE